MAGEVKIRILRSLSEQSLARNIFDKTWSKDVGTEITSNLLQAMVHNGAYLSGAFIDEKIVGASFGFAAVEPELHLHSHMTAVLPEYQDQNIGYQLKLHQKDWARTNGFLSVSWTFDPLVARNANFNINKLGAKITNYFANFYGAMDDELNAGDESDRLLARLATNEKEPKRNFEKLELISIPNDIVAIRKKELKEALKLRFEVREKFIDLLKNGYQVIGFNKNSEYELGK